MFQGKTKVTPAISTPSVIILKINFFFFTDFIYLFIYERHTQREAETQAEEEAGSMQGVGCGTQSWDSRLKASARQLSHPGIHGENRLSRLHTELGA